MSFLLSSIAMRRKPEPANMTAAHHAFLMIDLAVRECRQQRQIELTYFRVLGGEIMENAVIGYNLRLSPCRADGTRFVAQLLHEPGKLRDLWPRIVGFMLLPPQLLANFCAHRRHAFPQSRRARFLADRLDHQLCKP